MPDPVYAPLQGPNSALNTSLASGLVKACSTTRQLAERRDHDRVPAGHQAARAVTISGQTALVDLGGAAVHASPDAAGQDG